MSDTPRTDFKEYTLEYGAEMVVESSFARELESELAEARAEIERLKKLQQFATAINCAMLEADCDPEYLRGHECVAKHKLLSMFDLWRKKVRPRLPGFIDDEISKRDRLIGQMYEAIKFSLIADEVRQSRNVCASDINNACEDSRIKRFAALSAAERGGE